MQHLKRLSPIVLILTAAQLVFAAAIITITGHGLATLDYAPYKAAFFTPLVERLENGALSDADQATVTEIVRSFPVEVNRAFALSKHADKTALAIALCMLALPVAVVLRGARKPPAQHDARANAAGEPLYLVIETFQAGRQREIYERAQRQGRMLPSGVTYLGSWVTQDLTRCYQLMACGDPQLLRQWQERWSDVVDFEVLPVLESADAAARILN